MIDLHMHSFFSDGELIPSELIRRAEQKGYKALAITDHVDSSNLDFITPRLLAVCKKMSFSSGVLCLAGVEITHVDPKEIPELAIRARKLGAQVIVVHGETIVEPVKKGTNTMALKSDIDILAHPGLITASEARMAKKRNICLEISGRKGHSLCNGLVAQLAKKYSAPLVFDTDSHSPSDLTTWEQARKVISGAGITSLEASKMIANSKSIISKALSRSS